jgi:hypothetical protein
VHFAIPGKIKAATQAKFVRSCVKSGRGGASRFEEKPVTMALSKPPVLQQFLTSGSRILSEKLIVALLGNILGCFTTLSTHAMIG